MKSNPAKTAVTYISRVFLRTLLRLNPLCRPVVPAQVTVWVIAVAFTGFYIYDRILCTFINEYGELAVSAWGFLLLMNFLEALSESGIDHDDKG